MEEHATSVRHHILMPDQAFSIRDAVAYVDTVGILCPWRLRARTLQALRSEFGMSMMVRDVTALLGFKQFVIIHQPTFKWIQHIWQEFDGHALIVIADVAIDFLTPTMNEADIAGSFLGRHVVQKWRGKRSMNPVGSTRYWALKDTTRNIRLYSDRPSKSGEGPCAHLELTFRSADACRAAGLDQPGHLKSVNVSELLQKQVRLVRCDTARFSRQVRKTAIATQRNERYREWSLDMVAELAMRPRFGAIRTEDLIPDESTVHLVPVQPIADRLRRFRVALVPLMTWQEFSPPVRWLESVPYLNQR